MRPRTGQSRAEERRERKGRAVSCGVPARTGDPAYDAAEGAGRALDDDAVIGEAVAWLQTCTEAPAGQRRT